jgi:hypothetical protein
MALPNQADEAANPAAADADYEAAIRLLLTRLRNNPAQRLLNVENRNYGYTRNLLGLKRLGVVLAWVCLVIALLVGGSLLIAEGWRSADPLALPIVVSVVALLLWPRVNADMVRPAAEAYADRVMDGLEQMDSTP